MIKVREYFRTGSNKGNLKRELIFETMQAAIDYYNKVFVYNDFSLNPTLWERTENGWKRIEGY